MSVDRLPEPDFPAPDRGREGYRADEVDAFVAQVQAALRHDPPSLAPYEVVDQEFRVVRHGRRYRLQPVDDFLDRAEEQLREVHGEDAVADLDTRERPRRRHVRTLWIYLTAVVLVALMLGYALFQT